MKVGDIIYKSHAAGCQQTRIYTSLYLGEASYRRGWGWGPTPPGRSADGGSGWTASRSSQYFDWE
jgi:hypothetical protein